MTIEDSSPGSDSGIVEADRSSDPEALSGAILFEHFNGAGTGCLGFALANGELRRDDVGRDGGKSCRVCGAYEFFGFRGPNMTLAQGGLYTASAWLRSDPASGVEPIVQVGFTLNPDPNVGGFHQTTSEWAQFAYSTPLEAGANITFYVIGTGSKDAGACYLIDDIAIVRE